MARPREFDEKAVLDAAVQHFWARGYDATSVRELANGMGITGASLYNAFGDKRSLYRRALEHYLDASVRDRIVRLDGLLPPRQAVAAFLEEIIARSVGDKHGKGCMLVNAVLEVAPHDAEFRRVVSEELNQIESFFHRCIVAGQQSGEIGTAQSAEDLARMLLGVLLGIRVLARTRPPRAMLESVLRPALALLEPAPAQRRRRFVH